MLKILYVHGYLGSANGSSSQLLKETLDKNNIDAEVDAPAIPVTEPWWAPEFLKELSRGYDIVVASSMGAFYSLTLDDRTVIAINPADPDDIRELGKTAPKVNRDFCAADMAELDDIKAEITERLKVNSNDNVFGVFGGMDTIATRNGWVRDALPRGNIFYIPGMEHRADAEGMKAVIEIIKTII